MTTKQAKRRQIAKLRASVYGQTPWAIDVRTMGHLCEAIESRDMEAVKATMQYGEDAPTSMKVENGVAVIPITGVLQDECDYLVRYGMASSYQVIERDLKTALGNSEVSSVLLWCDSPGGSAIGCKRVADEVFRSRGDKPIRAYVQGVCGSAAFYICTAADRIEATSDSLIGSIGTILPHMEGSKAFEEFGLKYTLFTNKDSPKKSHGNIYEPLSDEAKKTLQDFTDSYGRPFIEDVARYRGRSADEVAETFGQGDAFVATEAVKRGMIDSIVDNFDDTLSAITNQPQATARGTSLETWRNKMKITERIKAQLLAMGLIDSMSASDAECQSILRAAFLGSRVDVTSEAAILKALRIKAQNDDEPEDMDDDEAKDMDDDEAEDMDDEPEDMDDDEPSDEGDDDEPSDEDEDEKPESRMRRRPRSKARRKVPKNIKAAHDREFREAKAEARNRDKKRLANLKAAAKLVNEAAQYDVVTSDMVLEAYEGGRSQQGAMTMWNKSLSDREPGMATPRVREVGNGAARFEADILDAVLYRAKDAIAPNKLTNSQMRRGETETVKQRLERTTSPAAKQLATMPFYAIAAECLKQRGAQVDPWTTNREEIAREAMAQAAPEQRFKFYAEGENQRYGLQAAGQVASHPGDFPNIMSSLANKFLDTIELDEDYSYPQISAVWPGGLPDFKSVPMMNKGIAEQLDEIASDEEVKEIGLQEEFLSHIYLRRFSNKWGWTVEMVANDDLGAFVEGMIGLDQAWQVTQNRLVLALLTGNIALLDGNNLFADRSGASDSLNINQRTSGATPSETEWKAMELLYSDMTGIGTNRRVRGALTDILVPTGTAKQDAVNVFATAGLAAFQYNLDPKVAESTSNMGIYRGTVNIIPESELRDTSAVKYYGLRTPTMLNTATLVRAYMNGYGEGGLRERWYDPNHNTTWVKIEGRIGVAAKNFRYAIENAGE